MLNYFVILFMTSMIFKGRCVHGSSTYSDVNGSNIDLKDYRLISNIYHISKTRMIRHDNFREVKEYDDENSNEKIEFLQHPADSLITGSFAVRIQCSAKNSKKLIIECDQKIRNDAVSKLGNSKSVLVLSLYIKPSDFEEHISCQCVAISQTLDESVYSNSAKITKSYLEEEFRNEPMDEVAYEGNTVELRCDPPKGNPIPSVYWLKDDVKINTRSGSSRVKLSNDFSLLILVANKEDTGNYVCVATNQVEVQFSHPAKLLVLDNSEKYMWSSWSDWSTCSSDCKQSIEKRYRHCETTNKMGQKEKVSISMCGDGHSFEDRPCIAKECVQSQWSPWSQWSFCSSECKKYRHRYCQTNNKILANSDQIGCVGKAEMSRKCNATECQQKQQLHVYDKIIKLNNQNKLGYEPVNSFYGLTINKTTLGVSIGIFSFIILVTILMGCILIAYLKRKRHKQIGHTKSDLNLYYTCEKPLADEECSLFKFTNCKRKKQNNISLYENSSKYYNNHDDFSQIYSPNKNKAPMTRMYENNLFGMNDSSNHIYHETTGIEQNFLLGKSQAKQYQFVQKNSMTSPYSNMVIDSNSLSFQNQFRPIVNKNSPFKGSNNSSTSSSLLSTNHHTPTTSCATKTSTLSSSPSSSTYYETSKATYHYHRANLEQFSPTKYEKTTLNVDFVNYANLAPNETKKVKANEEIYEVPDHFESCLNPQIVPTNNKNKIDSCAFINNSDLKKYNMNPDDLCVSSVNSDGVKLSLNCGISLIVPEGAIASDQIATIFLGISRSEIFKPKHNDKSTLLSDVILIGPKSLNLLKPVVLIMDHCIKNIKDWSITLCSNTTDNSEDWNEEHNVSLNNKNIFINSTETNFFLMIENLGRFALIGEALNPKNIPIAQKQFRLVVFYSSGITNNNFNMRIYCIDNLLVALQEVLSDEHKIGGCLLDASEPFLMSYSNDSLTICIEDLMPQSLNCKYNVNKQEVPLTHIWNRKNHLLHCSFTFEMNDTFNKQFNCKINAGRLDFKGSKNFDVTLNVDFNLSDLFNEQIAHLVEMSLRKIDASRVWPNTFRLLKRQNLITDSYKMNKVVREQVCSLLDKQGYITEKNWRMLAEVLEIDENLHYFASRTSPTDMLLLYFEAVSELRICEVNVLNYENTTQETKHLENVEPNSFCLSRASQLYDSLFHRTYGFLDSLSIL